MLGGNLDVYIHRKIWKRMRWAGNVPRLWKSRSENTVLLGKKLKAKAL